MKRTWCEENEPSRGRAMKRTYYGEHSYIGAICVADELCEEDRRFKTFDYREHRGKAMRTEWCNTPPTTNK
eukprot:scaffold640_cov126-Isochrysis_galbana.AAC.4